MSRNTESTRMLIAVFAAVAAALAIGLVASLLGVL